MTLERAIENNPFNESIGNLSAYIRYLRYNVDGFYQLESQEVKKYMLNTLITTNHNRIVVFLFERRNRMNTYLAIITTVLVATQIIRVTQNAIQLHRQNVLFEKQCESVRDLEITEADFELQRRAYKLIVERLEKNESR